jgi:dihydroflavonol-4-reductase
VERDFTYVLIGSSGHLGSTLLSLLSKTSYSIRAFDFKEPKERLKSPQIRYYFGDVSKKETLKAVFEGLEPQRFCVIDAAALIDIGARHPTPAMISVNVDGVKNVFEQFQKAQGSHFVYVSSVDAFLQTHSLVNESSPLVQDYKKAAGYPATKTMATEFLREQRDHRAPITIVYPSGILGPGDWGRNHLVQLLQDYLDGHLSGVVPGGYDVVDVRDVAKAIFDLSLLDQEGGDFILSGHQITLKDLLLLARKWNGGVGRKIRVYPYVIAYVGLPAIHATAFRKHTRPLYTAFSISIIRHANQFDHTLASNTIDYVPRPVETSVFDTLDFLKAFRPRW